MNYFAKNGRIIKKSVKGGHVPRRVMLWRGKREREFGILLPCHKKNEHAFYRIKNLMHVGYAGAVEKSALFDRSKDKDSQLSKYKKKTRDFTTLFCALFFTRGG